LLTPGCHRWSRYVADTADWSCNGPLINRCLIERLSEGYDDGVDAGAVAEEVVGHGVVGVLVVDDGLGDHGLELVEVHELPLGVHPGKAHEVGVGEEALDQSVDELLDL